LNIIKKKFFEINELLIIELTEEISNYSKENI